MTDEELQEALEDATNDISNLSRPTRPLPQHVVSRREIILLRQLILYQIKDAKKREMGNLERFNSDLYNLITACNNDANNLVAQK